MPTSLKLSLVAPLLSPDPRVSAKLAQDLTLDALEFPAYSPALSLPDLSITGRRDFHHLLASHNLQISSLHLDLGSAGFSPTADLDRLLTQLDRALETARSLSTPLLTIELGPLPEPPPDPTPKPAITPDLLGALILPPPIPQSELRNPQSPPINPAFVSSVDSALQELGRRADRYSTAIAFHSSLSTHAAVDRALRSASCPWFGLDLDPASALSDPWPIDQILSRLPILHLRARDAITGSNHRSRPTPLGQGSVNWPELLSLLDHASYQGFLTLDPTDLPHRLPAARAGIEFLRKI